MKFRSHRAGRINYVKYYNRVYMSCHIALRHVQLTNVEIGNLANTNIQNGRRVLHVS